MDSPSDPMDSKVHESATALNVMPISAFSMEELTSAHVRSSKRHKVREEEDEYNSCFEEDDLLDDNEEEWLDYLLFERTAASQQRFIDLMERYEVYEEEQLRLALRNERMSHRKSGTPPLTLEFPTSDSMAKSVPSSPE